MATRAKGESKAATIGRFEPDIYAVRRPRRAKPSPKLGALEHAVEKVKQADAKRAQEHEAAVVAPRRRDIRTQLVRLHESKKIDGSERYAGERLAADYAASGLEPNVVAKYESSGGGNASPPTLKAGPRFVEFGRAMNAMGIIASGLVVHVAIQDKPLDEWGASKGLLPTEALGMLTEGLKRLARHYGFRND
jgi:hypothetical protein